MVLHWVPDPQAFILFGGLAVPRSVGRRRRRAGPRRRPGAGRRGRRGRRRHLGGGGERGHRPHRPAAARPAGRAGPRGGRGRPPDRRGGQRRAPVELPWRDEVSAVLVCWFPGMEAGAALADVLLGVVEPGGRLPTTWPVALADAPGHRGRAHRRPAGVPRGPAHRAPRTPAGGHRAGVLVRPRPGLHDLGVGGHDRRGLDRDRPAAQHRRPGRASRSCRSTPPARTPRWTGRCAGWPGSPWCTPGPARWSTSRSLVGPRALRHWDVESGGWAVEPGAVVLSSGPSAGEQLVSAELRLR